MSLPMPEYMKVRSYIYNLIAKADGQNLLIPPENELCRIFGVSRITVRNAIKELVEEKYLIPRRGMGTFINPAKMHSDVENYHTIGVIIGDGQFAVNPWNPNIVQCITLSGMEFEPLYLPDSNDPATFIEIIKSGIDAVIWQGAAFFAGSMPYIEALKKNNIQLLLLDEKQTFECDRIVSLRGPRGAAVAEYMYERGHCNILFLHNDPSHFSEHHLVPDSTYSVFCRRMDELCGKKHRLGTERICSLMEFKKRLLGSNDIEAHFTALYSSAELMPLVTAALQAKGLKVPNDISYLAFGKPSGFFLQGLAVDYMDNVSLIQQAIYEWLNLRVNDGNLSGRFTRHVEMGIVPGASVKRI